MTKEIDVHSEKTYLDDNFYKVFIYVRVFAIKKHKKWVGGGGPGGGILMIYPIRGGSFITPIRPISFGKTRPNP